MWKFLLTFGTFVLHFTSCWTHFIIMFLFGPPLGNPGNVWEMLTWKEGAIMQPWRPLLKELRFASDFQVFFNSNHIFFLEIHENYWWRFVSVFFSQWYSTENTPICFGIHHDIFFFSFEIFCHQTLSVNFWMLQSLSHNLFVNKSVNEIIWITCKYISITVH